MELLAEQLELQCEAYGVDPRRLTGEERVEYVRMNVLAATDELHEALHQVNGWKAWQTERTVAGNLGRSYADELVDVAHFLFNLMLVAGVTDDIFEARYRAKRAENSARQKIGYNGNGRAFDREHAIAMRGIRSRPETERATW